MQEELNIDLREYILIKIRRILRKKGYIQSNKVIVNHKTFHLNIDIPSSLWWSNSIKQCVSIVNPQFCVYLWVKNQYISASIRLDIVNPDIWHENILILNLNDPSFKKNLKNWMDKFNI